MQYIANHAVGRFKKGQEVLGLSEKRAAELLQLGAIYAKEDAPQSAVAAPVATASDSVIGAVAAAEAQTGDATDAPAETTKPRRRRATDGE